MHAWIVNARWWAVVVVLLAWTGMCCGQSPTGTAADERACKDLVVAFAIAPLQGRALEREKMAPLEGLAKDELEAMMAYADVLHMLDAMCEVTLDRETRDRLSVAKKEQIEEFRAAIERSKVALTGDGATVEAELKNPENAKGVTRRTFTLKRVEGRWTIDLVASGVVKGRAETIEMFKEQTIAVQEVIDDVNKGREQAPLLATLLVEKKIRSRAIDRGLREMLENREREKKEAAENRQKAKQPPENGPAAEVKKDEPKRPVKPKVDPNPAEGERKRMVVPGRARRLDMIGANEVAVGSAYTAESLTLWNHKTGEKVRSYVAEGDEFHVLAMASTRDGTRIVVGGQVFAADKVREARAKSGAEEIVYGKDLLKPATLRVWDRRSGKLAKEITLTAQTVKSVDVSPNDVLVACGTDEEVSVFKLATGDLVQTISNDSMPLAVRFTPDGQQLVVSWFGNQHIATYGVKDWKQVQAIDVDYAGLAVQIDPVRKELVYGRLGMVVSLARDGMRWAEKPRCVCLCADGAIGSRVNGIAISGNGQLLVTAEGLDYDEGTLFGVISSRANVRVFDRAECHKVATLNGHADAVFDVAFTPDGKGIVTASSDGTVRVWDLPLAEKGPKE